jgi:metallo-beta-lactamase family protein
VPIYVDSPMALAALGIYRDAIGAHSPEVRPIPLGEDPFDTGDVHEMRTVEESKTLNSPRWPSIIISASGMASGGRVLHHLEGLLPDPRNTVLMVGYQAVSTRGRDLVDGARSVKIHGRYVPVRADVVDVPSFSVHADADEIVAWLAQASGPPQTCYLVHGEPQSSAALRDRIERELGWTAVVPKPGERVLIR